MNKQDYANYLASLSDWHQEIVREHLADYGEILPHVLANCITVPLLEALRDDDSGRIAKHCGIVEILWQEGDPEIRNVLEVTILERLSDDAMLWKRFGSAISPAFRDWINREIVPDFRKYLNIKKL